jgi:proline iminopeptidase
LDVDHSEDFVEVLGHELFVRTVGDGDRGNVLCLHGGPGATHDYMMPMADLAEHGYRVVFYDQLGCGRSERPRDRSLFVMERYVEEVEAVRKELHLGKIHIIGSSCGGQLGIAYALEFQRNMKSLLTVGGLHNVPLVFREMERLKSQLPPDVLKVLTEHESRGEYDDPEYLKAVDFFYRRHFCRLPEWPSDVKYTMDHFSPEVYHTMNGPNEFTIIGNIRYWDATPRLHTIKIPTLVTTGKYDEVTPRVARDLHSRIKSSKLVIFQKSAHLPFWEERGKFIRVASGFLNSV